MTKLIAISTIIIASSGCGGQSGKHRDTPATPDAPPATVTPEAPSAPAGGAPLIHQVSGDWFLTGTLTKARPGDPEWLLSATVQFPTGGFEVGKLIVRQTRSYPETVSIVIPVTPPPKDALVTQAITTVRIDQAIPGTDRASFQVDVETAERK